MSILHLHRVEPREMDLRVRPPPHFVIPTHTLPQRIPRGKEPRMWGLEQGAEEAPSAEREISL